MTPIFVRKSRIAIQIAFLCLFLFYFLNTLSKKAEPTGNIFFLFDPLIQGIALLSGEYRLGGIVLSLVIIGLAILFGRFWCGWVCPLGTMVEWAKIKKPKQGQIKEEWRKIKYILLFLTIFSAVLGNSVLLWLDPITLVNRSLTTGIFPGIKYAIFSIEGFLYRFPFLWNILDFFHAKVFVALFKSPSFHLSWGGVAVFILFTILGLNIFAERFWCRYLCPLGGFLSFLSKFSLFRRTVQSNCVHCHVCKGVCPTDTIQTSQGFRSDPSECILCYACIEKCPHHANRFEWVAKKYLPAPWKSYDPTRRDFLMSLVGAAGISILAGISPETKRKPSRVIRPPILDIEVFETQCSRCGECIRVCPTQGLQSSLLEGGWEMIFTPKLQPRLGPCNYSCNLCGKVCPTGAIPFLGLEEKRTVILGLASVDRNRCLPWAYQTPCIVCEESCPLPDKAIRLETTSEVNEEGVEIRIQKPIVIASRCIGCGICESQCPMGEEEAAIRVFSI